MRIHSVWSMVSVVAVAAVMQIGCSSDETTTSEGGGGSAGQATGGSAGQATGGSAGQGTGGSGGAQDAGACTAEGNTYPVIPNQQCCPGLTAITTASPDSNGQCPNPPPVGAMMCAKCGNSICGPGENVCNCPSDCHKDAGAACTPEGHTHAVSPGALPCCAGLTDITTASPNGQGQCPQHPPVGASMCANCGNSVCGPGENKCNCPADCH